MSEENMTQFKRRGQTSHVVEKLLEGRAQVWNLYCSVAGVEPYQSGKGIEEQVQEFCQLLVDYISLGHFGVYQRIIDGTERRKSIIDVAERVYPKIASATDAALNFNEKYQKLTSAKALTQLSDDLSILGDQLATRIELEDELISEMLT